MRTRGRTIQQTGYRPGASSQADSEMEGSTGGAPKTVKPQNTSNTSNSSSMDSLYGNGVNASEWYAKNGGGSSKPASKPASRSVSNTSSNKASTQNRYESNSKNLSFSDAEGMSRDNTNYMKKDYSNESLGYSGPGSFGTFNPLNLNKGTTPQGTNNDGTGSIFKNESRLARLTSRSDRKSERLEKTKGKAERFSSRVNSKPGGADSAEKMKMKSLSDRQRRLSNRISNIKDKQDKLKK